MRTSLVAQTVEVLREAITGGEWTSWLPGEMELTRRLQVSRVTLRSALAELERAKLIRGGQGRRREIIYRSPASKPPSCNRSVVLLSPEPVHRLSSSAVFWMDELREHLAAAGWPLEIHASTALYRRRPNHALEELGERLRPAGWVLYRSTPEMQRWFSENGCSAVIAGSRHAGVVLPSVDVDYAAGCRHAAGQFLAAGHHRLAIVRPDTELAGDLESVAGFESAAGSGEVFSALHDGTVRGICASLDRLFTRTPNPTALLVFQASYLLSVLGWLQRRGLHIPEDVSVLCRDDGPFLDYVIPAPSRYAVNPTLFARKISRLILGLVTGDAMRPRQYRISPQFLRGETVCRSPD